MAITPDDKDWTWVLQRPCPECGFDATSVTARDVPALLRANAARWPDLLADPRARERPTADRWSALEYGCHVRDVFELYDERLVKMLAEDGVRFANWDQDVTALEERYAEQQPAEVTVALTAAAARLADRFEGVDGDQWSHRGVRSDGAEFTVDSFARYFIHDPVHHVHDVEWGFAQLDGRSA